MTKPEWIFEPCESDHPDLPYAAHGIRPVPGAPDEPIILTGYGRESVNDALIDVRAKARLHDAGKEWEAAKHAIVPEMRMYSAVRG